MQHKSMAVGLFLIIGSKNISDIILPEYGKYMSVIMVFVGIGILIYSISSFMNEFRTNEKEKKEYLLKIAEHMQYLATKEEQENNRELLLRCFEELKKSLENKKIEILSGINSLSEVIQYVGIKDSDRQSLENISSDMECLKMLIQEEQQKILPIIEEMNEKQADLKDIPQIFCESVDELIAKDEKLNENIDESLRRLMEDLSEQYENLVDQIKNTIKNMEELVETYDSKTCEKLEQLSGQYDMFKKNAEEMIKQMSLMGQQDLEVIKGLMGNGE